MATPTRKSTTVPTRKKGRGAKKTIPSPTALRKMKKVGIHTQKPGWKGDKFSRQMYKIPGKPGKYEIVNNKVKKAYGE